MTEAVKKLIELDRKKDEVKKFFDEYNQALADAASEIGLNSMFQDDQGVVYRIVVPEGRFVYFDKLTVERTRRLNEERGTLSMSEARKAGFIVEGK